MPEPELDDLDDVEGRISPPHMSSEYKRLVLGTRTFLLALVALLVFGKLADALDRRWLSAVAFAAALVAVGAGLAIFVTEGVMRPAKRRWFRHGSTGGGPRDRYLDSQFRFLGDVLDLRRRTRRTRPATSRRKQRVQPRRLTRDERRSNGRDARRPPNPDR